MDNQVQYSEKVYFVSTTEDNLITTRQVQCLDLEMVQTIVGHSQVKQISVQKFGLANLCLVVLISSKMLEVVIEKTYL